MSNPVEDETTVNEMDSITVPAAVRQEAGAEAGDKLWWSADENGAPSVTLVKQQYGVFSTLEPVDLGKPTDAADDHDRIGRDD